MSEDKVRSKLSERVAAGRGLEARGLTCIQAAQELGMGKTAYQEAKRVVEAAEKDPAFNDLVERCIAERIIETYNQGRRKGKIEPLETVEN